MKQQQFQVLLAYLLLVLLMGTYVYHRELHDRRSEVLTLTHQRGSMRDELSSGRRERELNSVDADWLLSRGLREGHGSSGSSQLQQAELTTLQQRHDSLVELLAVSKANLQAQFTRKEATAGKLQALQAGTKAAEQQLELTWALMQEIDGRWRGATASQEEHGSY
ncbi:MAG: hypothetical protein WDW38_002636 [Sanguina aurantia]